MSSKFKFQQFEVSHSQSSMKVGTDSILLGAIAQFQKPKRLLDIGCGSGILSLMLAQRYSCPIDAIDIDKNSADEASLNFKKSIWSERLTAIYDDINEFETQNKYDGIICNPPYFDEKTYNQSQQKNIARHSLTLDFHQICQNTKRLSSDKASLWIVLPPKQHQKFAFVATRNVLFLKKHILVFPHKNSTEASLVISQWQRQSEGFSMEKLFIKDKSGKLSHEFKELTKTYLLQ